MSLIFYIFLYFNYAMNLYKSANGSIYQSYYERHLYCSSYNTSSIQCNLYPPGSCSSLYLHCITSKPIIKSSLFVWTKLNHV